MFAEHASTCKKRGGCNASAHSAESNFDVKTYLQELRKTLPLVPPIPVEELKYLHKTRDHKGIVRLVKRAMNIEDITFQVFWVPPCAANEGELKDRPAWVELPRDMPFFGTQPFKELIIKMFFRKELFDQAYDEAAAAVAHELSHVVLESIQHPLRSCEKVVDLAAMLLGFSRLYESACYKEQRSGNTIKIKRLGYLSREEIQLANQILAQGRQTPPPFGTNPHDENPESHKPSSKNEYTEKIYKPQPTKKIYKPQPTKKPLKPLEERCKECGRRLPEPIITQTTRFVYANPLLWSAFGASLITGAIVFLDRYSANQGVIWNAINGKTAGIPTHYFVAAGALLFFLGLALAAKK
jgi:hypothetical protein